MAEYMDSEEPYSDSDYSDYSPCKNAVYFKYTQSVLPKKKVQLKYTSFILKEEKYK